MNCSTAGLSLPADAAIDLHLHTLHSDGTWTPEDLLDYLRREQFSLAAVADHDRADIAVDMQQQAQRRGLPLLVAVEMTAVWRGEMTDLLCYGFAPAQGALHDLSRDVLRRQQDNTREVYENLRRQGYALPEAPAGLDEVLALPSSRQPHALVAYLKSLGVGQGQPSAGQIAYQAGCNFAMTDLPVVVETAHRSGAVCLIAHPGRTDGFVTYDAALLDQVRQEAPLDGLEAYYPRHTSEQTALYLDYAHRHDLLVSAGSDSHGADKPPVKYRAEQACALLERLGVRVI